MTTSFLDSGTKQKEAAHDSQTASVLDDINSEYDAKPVAGRAGGKSEFHDSGIDIANEKPPEHVSNHVPFLAMASDPNTNAKHRNTERQVKTNISTRKRRRTAKPV